MVITWDEIKRAINFAKHGLDFADLDLAFFDASKVIPSRDGRYIAIGEFKGRMIVATVFAALGTEAISVISMRPANRKERKKL